MMCFVHFDFEMCLAPQHFVFFQHLNSQKWSEPTSGLNVVYFEHVDLEMRFAQQWQVRQAPFHLSFDHTVPHLLL